MKPGAYRKSTWVMAINLNELGVVDGFVKLTGEYASVEWDSTCWVKIYNAQEQCIYSESGEFTQSGFYHEFHLSGLQNGIYALEVSHLSYNTRYLHVEIYPAGWKRIG